MKVTTNINLFLFNLTIFTMCILYNTLEHISNYRMEVQKFEIRNNEILNSRSIYVCVEEHS